MRLAGIEAYGDPFARRDEVREMRAAYIQRILASGQTPERPGEGPVREAELWPNVDIYCGHGHHFGE